MAIKCNKAIARKLFNNQKDFWVVKKGRPYSEGKLVRQTDRNEFCHDFDRLCRSANITWYGNGDKLSGLDFYREEQMKI